jgi:hypothetical protein
MAEMKSQAKPILAYVPERDAASSSIAPGSLSDSKVKHARSTKGKSSDGRDNIINFTRLIIYVLVLLPCLA